MTDPAALPTTELEPLRAHAEALARTAEAVLGGQGDQPELGEIESFRLAHGQLRDAGFFSLVVPRAHGGSDVGDLAPDFELVPLRFYDLETNVADSDRMRAPTCTAASG